MGALIIAAACLLNIVNWRALKLEMAPSRQTPLTRRAYRDLMAGFLTGNGIKLTALFVVFTLLAFGMRPETVGGAIRWFQQTVLGGVASLPADEVLAITMLFQVW